MVGWGAGGDYTITFDPSLKCMNVIKKLRQCGPSLAEKRQGPEGKANTQEVV